MLGRVGERAARDGAAAEGKGERPMVAFGLCAAFSGLAGLGLSLALAEGQAPGPGLALLALGVVGLAGVVSSPLRSA
jgi:hypothetical protein